MSRGTGKTYNALMALPAGSIYLVHHERFVVYCKAIRPDLKYISAHDSTLDQRLRGLPPETKIAIDHYVFESGAFSEISPQAKEKIFWRMPK